MKASRATHRADVVQPSISFTLRLPKALVLGIVAFVTLVLAFAGLTAPAKAAVAWSPPVALSTAATTPGNGVLTVTPVIVSDAAYTVSPHITGGATFASGATSVSVEIVGATAVMVPYSCTAPGGYITLGFGFKGSPILSANALCGAVVVPAPVWVQHASIVPSTPGSGNADVVFDNEGSNQVGGFYVTFGGGAPTSATSVAAGQTKSIPVHAEPGTVVRVYGTKDGSAAPQMLAELVLPMALPDPGLPISYTGGSWDGQGHGTLNPVGKFTTPDSVYLLTYQNDKVFSSAGPIVVDGTHAVSAAVNYPDCGSYDVYFSTTADLSGAIRWSKHVEKAACLVDDGHTKQIAFCHATGNDEKYVALETSVNSFYQAGHNTHQDGRDIVPAGTTYVKHGKVETIAAQNWDADGQAIFNNDCVKPDVVVPPVDDTPKSIGGCFWEVGGKFHGYVRDSMRVGMILRGEGENFSKHIIPPFDYTRDGVVGHYDGQNWTDENQELFGSGCKPQAVEPPYVPNEPEEPATPESPEVPAKPATPVVPAEVDTKVVDVEVAQHAKPEAASTTDVDRSKVTFETAASEPVTQGNPWGAIALFAIAAAIIAAVVRRWWTAA